VTRPAKPSQLRFEMNQGQTDADVRFLAATRGGDVFLTSRELVLRVRKAAGPARASVESAVVRLQIVGANPDASITGLDPLPGQTNYFIGGDPSRWRTRVPSFARVKYAEVYPGIDLICYGNEGKLEYDFEVAPGADPARIAMSVQGAESFDIDTGGDLVLRTAIGEVRQYAPRIYQQYGKEKRAVAGGYVMRSDGRVSFRVARYAADRPLVIDPQLVYGTYFGGTTETDIHAIKVDAAGSVYVAGATFAVDFPTKNPLQPTNRHTQSLSAFVSKFSPDGASLVYSTYLGGSDAFTLDAAVALELDFTGAVYVTGTAGSSDFPTRNAFQPARGGFSTDAFVSKISPDGATLVYSSYLGGTGFDLPRGIVVDASKRAYVFGQTESTDFPTVNPTQAAPGGGGHRDGFWSIVGADGSQLLFSTYVGGNDEDDVQQLRIFSPSADVWIAGRTQSSDFGGNTAGDIGPYQGFYSRTGPGSFAPNPLIRFAALASIIPTPGLAHASDGVAGVRNASDASLSAWRGTGEGLAQSKDKAAASRDMEVFISNACAIVPPATTCTGRASVATEDASTLTFTSAVNIADTIPLNVTDVLRDSRDAIYVTGTANRTEVFPLVNPIQPVSGGGTDAYVMVFAPATRAILFSTFLGGSGNETSNGIAIDPQGNIHVAGQTQSSNFPTRNAFQPTAPAPNGASIGQGNSFIAKMPAVLTQVYPCFPSATVLCVNGDRFRVEVTWTKPDGSSGAGQAIALTGDTGYFWFFSANNIEMVIKVVDGRPLNSRFWVFAGGLTNVQAVINVTDTQTGAVRSYTNPQGVAFAPIQDTSAFTGLVASSARTGLSEAAGPSTSEAAPSIPAESARAPEDALACGADATNLCLNAGRFRVAVAWTKPDGTTGAGQAVSLTSDTGYFWFFTSNNVEMVIKVVDGRAFNSRYWVFAGGLTNVQVLITVTDTQTGSVKTYSNNQGVAFAPIQDTAAFH
jgi:hypothetical protein